MFELQYFIIGIVQGFTEFLPISSSGHLVLVSLLTSWQDQGLFTDVAVHVGTLFAVIIYPVTQKGSDVNATCPQLLSRLLIIK